MIKLGYSSINESRDYPLYHATSINALVRIINNDELKALSPYAISKDKVVYGMSLTRDINFARNWINRDVIIEFNSNILSYNQKLIPRGATNAFSKVKSSKNGKAEEFLCISDNKGDSLKHVKKYISKIYVDKSIDKKYDLVNQLQNEGLDAEVI